MRRTFNLGVGLIIVVPKSEADTVVSFSARKGLRGFVMGEVE